MSLEEILAALAAFGRPSLFQFKDGRWHCCVNLNVSAVGMVVEIKSDNSHITPTKAAAQCLENLRSAMAEMQGKAGTLGTKP